MTRLVCSLVFFSREAFSYASAIFWALRGLASLVEIRRCRPPASLKQAVQNRDCGCFQMEAMM